MNALKGKLIVIEGTDGSGKETQSKKLCERLRNEGIVCPMFDFPRYKTPTGDIIERYLGKPPYQQEFGPANDVPPRIASTWFASDRKAAAPEIRALLAKGFPIICNRYAESNMAHQGGKITDSQERSELISWLDNLEYGGAHPIPRPDLVVFLYMPHQVANQLRIERALKEGKENTSTVVRLDGHEGNIEHMLNAERTYIELAGRFGWTRVNCAPDGIVARSVEDIGKEVYDIVSRKIQNT